MKKVIFTLFWLLFPVILPAQTIHWLTFIDTTDKNVGDIDKNVRKVLFDRVVNNINAAIKEKGYSVNILDIYGPDVSPQKCKNLVTSLSPDSDDIVVFYYVGHGTHGAPGGDKWPMMAMAQHNPSLLIPLKWVHDQLKSKNARLTVTIGMCCNSHDNIPRLNSPSFCVNYSNASLTEREIRGLQKLFTGYIGDILITSASPGESSGCVNTPLGVLDTFTWCFLNELALSSNDNNPTWADLTSDLTSSVSTVSRAQTPYPHTPVYAVNVNSASAPTKKKSTPVKVDQPKSQQNTTADDQKLLNQLGAALDIALDREISRSERGVQIDRISAVFTPDASIKVMSQDGTFIVDCIPASNYFMQLIIKDSLIKVAPIDARKSGNHICELKVKETYKK
ncbi:MAG: caspase family protein [Muribaculaceae bacterium]|nr:caspase family protein [Muribaculaceae bacterium]